MLVLVVFFSLFGHGGCLGYVPRAILSYPYVVTLLTHWIDMNDDGLLFYHSQLISGSLTKVS